MDDNNRNLILASALSFLVILIWFYLFPPETPEVTEEAPVAAGTEATPGVAATPTAPASNGVAATPSLTTTPIESREAALAMTDRVSIKTPRLSGSLSLTGGRIDDLSLLDYNVNLNDPSEKETLLSPAAGPNAYYALYGWAPAGDLSFEDVPGASTPWTVESGSVLTETSPVSLVWDNGKGVTFRRTISVDENYMFSIKQSVENNTGGSLRMAPYGIIARHGEPETIGFYILHEGVVRASDGEIQEIDYDDMPDQNIDPAERAAVEAIAVEQDGWIGFTDKYWMTTLIPASGQSFNSVSKYTAANDTYQTDMRLPVVEIAAGTTHDTNTSLFAGAKEWDAIADYQKTQSVDKFVDSIDWGWFFFLTKPIFQILHWLNGVIGNMGVAIIGLTLLIKAILFPLAYKSFVSMAKMKELQPEMEKIKEAAGEDRQKQQQEIMKLYKDKKVNPAAGCLPILLQIPIFFSLYKVIFVTIELRHAPFFGWIHDLSAPDPTSFLNLFGLLPWATPGPESFFAIFSIGVFPILMGITMWLQQKLNPAPTDKTQAQIFAWMPWVFMFMLGQFASGLVVPIKAHGREALNSVTLESGRTFPWDRVWAVAHEAGKLDPSNRDWARCINFTRGASSPALMAVTAELDEVSGTVTLRHPALADWAGNPDVAEDAERLIDWTRPLIAEGRPKPAFVTKAAGRGMTDSQFPSISILSHASLRALADKAGQDISPHRWRGNFWIDGVEPWAEFDWLGRELKIGEVKVAVRERIERCKATTVNPETGERDLDTLALLKGNFGHQDFGVKVEVVEGGQIQTGDKVELI
jgi:YidC/Oxa1 family membrane protein insertase